MRRSGLIVIGAWLSLFFLLAGSGWAGKRKQGTGAASRHVNQDRLWTTLQKLGEFGKNPEGGVSRVGFTEADLTGRAYVIGLMREAGLAVRIDPAGNIFGHRSGTEKLPLLLFGSHIDSVPHGGNYDGDVGSLGALEVIRALDEEHLTTRHPLEVVIWTNEEGGRFYSGLFGSSAAAGILPADIAARQDENGEKLCDWLSRMGGDASRIADAKVVPGRVSGYLELHIEQGALLDEANVPIGVVTGIVGISLRICTASGFANHAGTTPMTRRKDALAAASRAVLAVRDEVRSEPGRQVGTVGSMKIEPGASNVIPGRVTFPVELRDLDKEKIDRIGAKVIQRFQEIGRQENVQITCAAPDFHAPALTAKSFQDAIRTSAREAGLGTLDLPSGAGHDAQNAAHFAPVGMIFVPSRGGISHSPLEYTSPDQAANGAEVLYRALLKLDAQLDGAIAPH
ncbi:MAG TPA: Zn-dependent hydrolase [Candidatus Acidoferrum sp.]|nr:Zn-dependent hydrolase [Candidatus Acidoferrum sp.]